MSSTHRDPTDTDLAGVVLGSYRIISEISSGGMGTVYRAQHTLLGRAAAVKLLRPQLTANAELVQRFFTEARAASGIQHPGIVEVFDFGYATDGRAYLIMEFLDGQPLGERLRARGGRLGEIEAAQIARGIASALTAAHVKGIIHRDLKPDNVFLVPDPDLPSGERPKLLDFGIAKLADGVPPSVHQTQTGALIGTPLYMAPEQARAAAAIDQRADLYSLGCMLYELLVGEPPFVATGAGEIIAMHMFTPPPSPRARVTTSPEMEAIVMRLLAKDPRERFQTAAEVAGALAAIGGFTSGGHRLPQPGPPPPEPLVDTPMPPERVVSDARTDVRKRSRVPLVAGALTLVAAVAAIAIVIQSGDDPPSAPPAPAKAAPPPAKPIVTPSERVVVPAEPVVVPAEPVVVPAEPTPAKSPPSRRVVTQQLPPDAGAARPARASEVKQDDPGHTESGSPVENDIGTLKDNHKPLGPANP